MNSRERVRATLNFKEPDRIPVDWGLMNIVGITEVAYKNLIDHLGIVHTDIKSIDPVQGLVEPCEELLQRFHVDTRVLFPNPPSTYSYQPDEQGNFYNENGAYFKKVGYYCDFVDGPLYTAESIDDLKKFKLIDPTDPARFAGMRERAKDMYENTDYALVPGHAALLHYTAWTLRGYQNYMLDLALDKAFAYYLLDMIMEWDIAYMGAMLGEIGEYMDIVWIADDLGVQNGAFMNPDEIRNETLPRFKKVIDAIKKKTNAKICMHSCGSTDWVLPDLMEIGVDIVQPLQPNAIGNEDSKRLKQMVKGRMTIHGGLDNQGKFHLSEQEVREDVKQKIRDFAPGGGYLFSCGHNIQANCPPENIVAIFDTYDKYANYPISID